MMRTDGHGPPRKPAPPREEGRRPAIASGTWGAAGLGGGPRTGSWKRGHPALRPWDTKDPKSQAS